MSNYSNKFIKFLEHLFIICALLYYLLDLNFRLDRIGDLQILFFNLKVIGKGFGYFLYTINLYLFFVNRQQVISNVKKNKYFGFLLLFVLGSIFWSYTPIKTFFSILSLFNITLFSIYLTTGYSLKKQLELLAFAFGIIVSLSLITIFAFPSYGTMQTGLAIGSWEGIYGNKNILGGMSLLSALIFYLFSQISTKYFFLGWFGLSASVCLIIGSASRSALVNTLVLLIVLPSYRVFRMNFRRSLYFWTIFTAFGGLLIIFCLFNAETILSLMGRDLTLSSRTILWKAELDYFWQQPWFGYGYQGFWHYIRSTSNYPGIMRIANFHSHNGFLELTMDLGLLGLSIFIFTYLHKYFQAIVFIQKNNTRESFWHLYYLTFLFMTNLTETRLLGFNIFYLLWVTTVFGLTSDLKENRVLWNSADCEIPKK